MNEDMEHTLRQLTPCSAPGQLRQRVLEAVDCQLSDHGWSRTQRVSWLAVAAALLLGVFLNHWVARVHSARLAALFGPDPVPASIVDVVEAVQSVTNEDTGHWVRQRLVSVGRRSSETPPTGVCSIGPTHGNLETLEKEWNDEGSKNSIEAGGHPRRVDPGDPGRDRDTSDYQRGARMEIGQAA